MAMCNALKQRHKTVGFYMGFFFFSPNKNYSYKYQTGNGWNIRLTKGREKKKKKIKKPFHANLKVYKSAPR
ncbi:hypothetical protein I7I48_03250 [Histoplasma ohiense]|nr:hypothetical protein I7I48_03250 [Histoplasma ohiense (nom. inval.)]